MLIKTVDQGKEGVSVKCQTLKQNKHMCMCVYFSIIFLNRYYFVLKRRKLICLDNGVCICV